MNRIIRTTVVTLAAWGALSGLAGCGHHDPEAAAPAPAPTQAPPPVTVTHEKARPVGRPDAAGDPGHRGQRAPAPGRSQG